MAPTSSRAKSTNSTAANVTSADPSAIVNHRVRNLRVNLEYDVEDYPGRISTVTADRFKKNHCVVWVKDTQGQQHRFVVDQSFEAENLSSQMLAAIVELIGKEHLGQLGDAKVTKDETTVQPED